MGVHTRVCLPTHPPVSSEVPTNPRQPGIPPCLLTLKTEPKAARPWDERRKCNLGFDIMKVSLL